MGVPARMRPRSFSRRYLRRLASAEPRETHDERPPRTRAECAGGPRPCPWVRCRHHLYLEVTEAGSIKLNFPHLELDELPDTCALDVAERVQGGATLDAIAQRLNVTKERARQLEERALVGLARRLGDIE